MGVACSVQPHIIIVLMGWGQNQVELQVSNFCLVCQLSNYYHLCYVCHNKYNRQSFLFSHLNGMQVFDDDIESIAEGNKTPELQWTLGKVTPWWSSEQKNHMAIILQCLISTIVFSYALKITSLNTCIAPYWFSQNKKQTYTISLHNFVRLS